MSIPEQGKHSPPYENEQDKASVVTNNVSSSGDFYHLHHNIYLDTNRKAEYLAEEIDACFNQLGT